MTSYLLPLALLTNGVAGGVMLSTVVGTVPMFGVLPYGRYVRAVQFLWPRYDPMMPALTVSTFVLDVVLAVLADSATAAALFAAGAALVGVVIAVSVLLNVPMNRYVMGLDPDRCPRDWVDRDPRQRWRRANTLRTSLTLAALVADLLATATLL